MTNKIDYNNVLNPAQLEAVTTLKGPVLVVAGAGSGKTRTLIYRVARLVETGVPPEAILLLTFTRKASEEMLRRASELSDARCRFVSGGTFHSLALQVLRRNALLLGLTNGFAILDRPDMEEALSSLIPELSVPSGGSRFPKRNTLAGILSKAANVQNSIDEIITEEYVQFIEFIPQINRLLRIYAEYKKAHQLMDYDDLILNLRKLLTENVDVRADISRQYQYVMVDEYQDTNAIQADIVKCLAQEHRNIMIVGDDSQSIYSFRGADYKNIFNFKAQFPETKLIKLEENYRSTQPILMLANSLMDQASEKYAKCLFTKREGGKRPEVVDTRSEPEQAMFICRKIKEMIEQDGEISDIAVLFRAGHHSFELEAELTRERISYIKYGGFKFLESAHIKDFLAHLRVVVNRNDTISWSRILRLINNVGKAKTKSIIQWMKINRKSPEQIGEYPWTGKMDNGLKPLSKLLGRLSPPDKLSPEMAIEQVLKYYIPFLKKQFDNYPKRKKELEQLISMASRYKKLSGFLDDLVLEPPASSADMNLEDKAQSLILSTVHSAKGLEWPIVFIIWAMEGWFPPARAFDKASAMEEELRLMYVAATRAKDQVIICYPGRESMPRWSSSRRMGRRGFRRGLSSFIQQIPEGLLSYISMNTSNELLEHNRKTDSPVNLLREQPDSHEFSQGDRVNHPAFGRGVISRYLENDKVEVLFRDVGRKLLHLEHTTLEKV